MDERSKANMLLMLAIDRKNHSEIERLLLIGADPNFVNSCVINGNCTPLHVAIAVADPVAIGILLQWGAKCDTKNKEGMSPLEIAQLMGNLEIITVITNHLKKENPAQQNILETLQMSKWVYTRRPGTSSIAGQFYEYKLLALILLRLKKGGYQFLLGSNVEGIGDFDDLCLRYRRVEETKYKYVFIQAKHREDPEKKKITSEMLNEVNRNNKNFENSLHKHFENYLKFRSKFVNTSGDNFFDGHFEDSNVEFVLYTTANCYCETNININCDTLLKTNTDGKAIMIVSNDEMIKSLCTHVNDAIVEQIMNIETKLEKTDIKKTMAIDFLKKFKIYYSQAMENEVEKITGSEINIHPDNRQLLNLIYHDLVQKYWIRKGEIVYLTEFCGFLEEAEQIIADRRLLSHLTKIFYGKITSYELLFCDEALKELQIDQFISDPNRTYVNIHSKAPQISLAKISQYMVQKLRNGLAIIDFDKIDDFTHIFSEFYNLINMECMVICCTTNTRKLQNYVNSNVQKIRKKIIFTSDEPFYFLQGCEIKLDTMNDMDNLTLECQEMILKNKIIKFQNTEVELFKIMGYLQDIDHVPRKWITGEILFKMLNGNIFEIAPVYIHTKPIEYFVERSIHCDGKYKTIIKDVDSFKDRVVIIAAAPGMGKSTLLTELSKHNTSVWIVRYNLLDFTEQLSKIHNSSIDLRVAIEFILHTLGLPKPSVELRGDKISLNFHQKANFDSLQMLQLKVFESYFNQKKVIVFADGFDEIAPPYMNSVLHLLNILKNCNVRKLLVTTRDTSVSVHLENNLGVRAYNLVPFSMHDILDFCKKFWELNLNFQEELNKNRVQNFVYNVISTYTVYNYEFMCVPLHAEMIARCIQEKFEFFYKNNDRSYTNRPDYTLNEFSLFKKFIHIKYEEIYLKDKNKIDPTLPICMLDGGLKESFYNRHKRLALCALFDHDIIDLLSPETLIKLSEDLKTVQLGKERCGFVCRFSDGKPQFTHLTFAEYFVADVIWERFRLISIGHFAKLFEKVLNGFLIANDRKQICIFLQGFAMHEKNSVTDSSAKAYFLLKNITFVSNEISTNSMLSLIESCLTDTCSDLLKIIDGLPVEEKREIFSLSVKEGYTNLLRAMNGMISQTLMKKQTCNFELLSQAKEDENLKTANILVNEHGYDINWLHCCNTTCLNSLMKFNSFAKIRAFVKSGLTDLANPIETLSLPLLSALERKEAPQDLIETLLNATNITYIQQNFVPQISYLLLSHDLSLTEAFLKKGVDMMQTFLFEQEHNSEWFTYLLTPRWMNQMQLFFGNGVGFHSKLLKYVREIQYIFKIISNASAANQSLAHVCLDSLISSKSVKSLRLKVGSTSFDKSLFINNKVIIVDKFNSETIFNIDTTNNEEIIRLLKSKQTPSASIDFNNFISGILNSTTADLSYGIFKHICSTHLVDAEDMGDLVGKLSIIVPMLENLHSHYLKFEDAIKSGQLINVKNALTSIQNETHRKTIINGRDESFGSPLLYVAATNDNKIAELLLEYGANPNIILYYEKNNTDRQLDKHFGKFMDYKTITPLHIAACLGNLDLVKLLHMKGANIHLNTPITPLHLAAREGHVKIVQYFIEHDAKVDSKTFKHRSSSNVKDFEDRTPLELALQNGHTEVVMLLKSYQPTLANGFTELHRAAACNDLDEVRILIQFDKVAINSTTKFNGYTPLHVAAENGHAAVVLFLLRNKADKNAKSLKGQTPKDVALKKGHSKVVNTLESFKHSDFQQSYIPDFKRIRKEEDIYIEKHKKDLGH